MYTLRDIYDEYAPRYVATVTPIAHYYKRVAKFLAEHAKGTVLDIGCGPGHLTAALPPDVNVIGLDLSPNMIEAAKRARPSGTYIVHDFHQPLPFDTASVDVVIAAGVLDFCFTLDPVVGEIARVMRDRGRAFLTFVDRQPHDPARRPLAPGMPRNIEMYLYTRKELRRAFVRHGLVPITWSRGPGYLHRGYKREIEFSYWDLERQIRAG